MNTGKVCRSLAEALQSPEEVTILEIAIECHDKEIHPIPPEIVALVNLEQLAIFCPTPTFLSISDEIGSLKKLKALHIRHAPVKHISPRIGELASLESLYLSCELTGLPDEITQLGKLKELGIGSDQLRNLPENMDRLKNLEHLHLYGAPIQRLPASLGDLPNLTSVSLGGCPSLDIGQVFGVLSRLPKLRHLDLFYSAFTTLPVQLGECETLEFLDLSANRHLQDIEQGTKAPPNWNTIRLDKSNTVFKKALKKLLPDGRLITKWTREDQPGTTQEYSGAQRYVRKAVELIWDGVRVTPLP